MPLSIPEWVADAIFYQIFPDRFAKRSRLPAVVNLETWESPPTTFGFKGGDLWGVTAHLDYLQNLGITALYFNPVFASAANHRYHTYDYFTVDPLLGGNAALRALLDAAHARNIKVILDGVFNHASRGFWQFHHVLENGGASPYADWFFFDPERLSGKRHFAPYPDPEARAALQRGAGSQEVIGYQAWWNLPALPKFNTHNPAVREFLWNVASHWISFGIDGWRLDVPEEIDDDAFWREFRRRVKAINPDAYLVGEIWHEAQRWLQGDQFDAVMNYPLTVACLGFFCGERLSFSASGRPLGYHEARPLTAREFADRIDKILHLYDPAITQAQLNLLDSHDTPRFLTTAGGDTTALKLALLFLFTYPGAPCVYYGDEVGLEGEHDPDCRRTFLWDTARWDHDVLAFVKKCIALRHAHPALRRGMYVRLYADDDVYVFGRKLERNTLIIALNTAAQTRPIDVPVQEVGLQEGMMHDVWSGVQWPLDAGTLRGVTIPARSGAVLVLR